MQSYGNNERNESFSGNEKIISDDMLINDA